MRNCKCGYALLTETGPKPDVVGYAVINNNNYLEFLDVEFKAHKSGKLEDIGVAAEFVGNLHVCPKCARLGFVLPAKEDGEPVFYVRDND